MAVVDSAEDALELVPAPSPCRHARAPTLALTDRPGIVVVVTVGTIAGIDIVVDIKLLRLLYKKLRTRLSW